MSTILTMTPDINYLSIASGVTSLNATANPDSLSGVVGWPIPRPLILIPGMGLSWAPQPIAFDSVLKVCDGTTGLVLGGVGSVIAQGTEGCVDIANGVAHVSVTSTYGATSGSAGQRVTSIKGGCIDITIAGHALCSGTETEHLLGEWCDQSQASDKQIDYSATNGRVIIARGFPAYVFWNRNQITLGVGCHLDVWGSIRSWLYVMAKGVYVWALGVIPTGCAVKLDHYE